MTLSKYLTIMGIFTVISWLSLIFVLWTVNPESTNTVGFILFYVSLFISLLGTSAIMGFVIRFVAMKKELAFTLVRNAFRQSFLFAALVVICLFLMTKDLLTWLNLSFLVIGLSVLEFFLLGYENN